MTTASAPDLSTCLAALTALRPSMGRYHGIVFGHRPSYRRGTALRAAGWASLAPSFALAVLAEGAAYGPVRWLGTLTVAALVVIGLLSYRPRWVAWIGASAPLLGLVAGLLAWCVQGSA